MAVRFSTSAALQQHLNGICKKAVEDTAIYVDTDGMHYGNNFDPWQVVSWASESKHGADYYQTGNTDFWTVFTGWCNENLINTLKYNLRRYGLKTR